MAGREEVADLSAYGARHRVGFGLEHSCRESCPRCDGGDFEPDVAGSDNEQSHPVREFAPDGFDVVDRPQVVDPGELRAGNGQPARFTAGREQQMRVIEHLPAAQGDPPACRIERFDPRAETQIDLATLEKLRGLEVQAVAVDLPGEETLRQRRALIRQVRFGADQADAAPVSRLTCRLCCLGCGLSAAGYDEMLTHESFPRWK